MEMKTIHIGDLGDIITGSTPSKKNPDNYGDYALWIKPTDINPDEKYTTIVEEMFSEKAAHDCRTRMVPAKSVCVPCIGTVGTKLTMTPCDCFVNQSINAVIPNEDYDNDYVYYLLLNFLPTLKSYNKGTASGREYIAKSAFENIEIKVHSDINIQRKIGKILSAYDYMIDNCKKQIALLEEAAQRLYREWFVDMHYPDFWDTQVGDNGFPIGWIIFPILDIYNIAYGKTLPTSKISPSGKYPVYGSSKCIGYYDKNTVDDFKVLITSRGNAGRVHRTYHKKSFVTNNSFVVTPRPEFDHIPFSYIFYSFIGLELTRIVNGSAQQQLTNAMLDNVTIIVPPKNIVEQFGTICNPYIDQINMLHSKIEKIIYCRDLLLPRLISGEIKIDA